MILSGHNSFISPRYRIPAFILLRKRLIFGHNYEAEIGEFAGTTDRGMNDAGIYGRFVAPKLQAAGQRTERLKKQHAAFFGYFTPEALNDLLEKYAADGELRFTRLDVLRMPRIRQHGGVAEIIGRFGGVKQVRNAIHELQMLPYAA